MELFELLKKMIDVFEELEIPYLVTGSVASMAYGEPRLTNDIDIVAEIKPQQVSIFIESFPVNEYYISVFLRDHGFTRGAPLDYEKRS